MVSLARASHFSSWRSCSKISVAKNFVLLRGGWPSGFSIPAATKIGISWVWKPKNHAAWVALRRAGGTFQLKNSFCCDSSFITLRVADRKPRAVYSLHKSTQTRPRQTHTLLRNEPGSDFNSSRWRFSRRMAFGLLQCGVLRVFFL